MFDKEYVITVLMIKILIKVDNSNRSGGNNRINNKKINKSKYSASNNITSSNSSDSNTTYTITFTAATSTATNTTNYINIGKYSNSNHTNDDRNSKILHLILILLPMK